MYTIIFTQRLGVSRTQWLPLETSFHIDWGSLNVDYTYKIIQYPIIVQITFTMSPYTHFHSLNMC